MQPRAGRACRLRLRAKALLTLGLTFAVLGLGLRELIPAILLPAFEQAEQSVVCRELARAQRALLNMREDLASRAADWGEWDELYRFAEDGNDGFIQANFDLTSLSFLRVDLVAVVDGWGRLVFGRMIDHADRRMMPLPSEFSQRLGQGSSFIERLNRDEPGGGLLSLPQGPIILASSAIRTSHHQGPPRGTLIFGRLLTGQKQAEYSRQAAIQMSLHSLDDAGLPADCARAVHRMNSAPGEAHLVQAATPDSVAGYRILVDTDGNHTLLLRVAMERSIHRRGQLALQYLHASLLAVGALGCIATVVLLDRLVLRRLVRLNQQLSTLGQRGDLTMRVSLHGGDELSGVADNINGMLDSMWQAESALRMTQFSVDHATDAIFWVRSDGRVIYANEAACRSLEYSKEELLRKKVGDFDTSFPNEHQWQSWRQTLAERGHVCFESHHRTRTGRVFPVEITFTLLNIEGQECSCTFVRDITRRKQADGQLRHAALHDALTGLANRSLLEQHLAKSLARARRSPDYRFAVMFLDFDRFKIINDSLGHQIGDQLLVAIARRLQACVRAVDVVSCSTGGQVARLGGDEFVILLDGIRGVQDASSVAERLHREMAEPFLLSGHQVHVTVSIGIVSSDLGYHGPEEMLRDADTAMYQAKAAGKARHVIFDRQMHDQAMKRLKLESSLRDALERREIKVLYQPIVCLESGAVEGLEALARWESPEQGLVSPEEFIPIAAETGLIVPLGRLVLRTACERLAALARQLAPAEPPVLSLNLSEGELLHPGLVDATRSILDETGVRPEWLRLEIAESIIMERAEDALPTIWQLKSLGVRLCMDDFGQGRSSLSCLHRFPLDFLKIGRDFIRNLGPSESGLNIEYTAIMQAIVTLAHNLGIKVTAVGVESSGQVAQLQSLSCDYAQGYQFSRPVPPEKIAELLAARSWADQSA